MKGVRKALVAGAVVLALLVAFGWMRQTGAPASPDNVFRLQAPPFVGVARAETGSVASLAEDEIGMSAYLEAPTGISLDDVRDLYRTIETETADYIIGSIPIGEYPETEDIHVYVHTDGWILAYYLVEDPVGKIFDWRAYHDSGRTVLTTRLENMVAVVAGEAAVPYLGGDLLRLPLPKCDASHVHRRVGEQLRGFLRGQYPRQLRLLRAKLVSRSQWV